MEDSNNFINEMLDISEIKASEILVSAEEHEKDVIKSLAIDLAMSVLEGKQNAIEKAAALINKLVVI